MLLFDPKFNVVLKWHYKLVQLANLKNKMLASSGLNFLKWLILPRQLAKKFIKILAVAGFRQTFSSATLKLYYYTSFSYQEKRTEHWFIYGV